MLNPHASCPSDSITSSKVRCKISPSSLLVSHSNPSLHCSLFENQYHHNKRHTPTEHHRFLPIFPPRAAICGPANLRGITKLMSLERAFSALCFYSISLIRKTCIPSESSLGTVKSSLSHFSLSTINSFSSPTLSGSI